ncbi:dynamin-binding protein-like protein [Dinothrombium tinctorium]|uniref:Dynamin-binding protein-like protein n=1 Tax=Dinothrombium tinctorium TaxID=1965070 RepID=A0A3S4QFB5_9ACAR|nr:dynamin-binding protein-like protein [Dinothrombium tinctorium]
MNCLIRITHDYEANAEQELSVLRGDIVQVTGILDRHWYRGHCNGFDGTFPSSCGEEIEFNEPLTDGQQVFAAFSDFPAIEKDDLELRRGDLVIGYHQLDDFWWKGKVYGTQREGMFPLTHVWRLNKTLFGSNQSGSNQSQLGFGTVNQDMKAQLENELDLKKGETVRIIRSVDKLYYEGECNGRKGIFPKAFVTLVEEETSPLPSVNIDSHSTYLRNDMSDLATTAAPPSYNEVMQFYANVEHDNELQSYGQAMYSFKAEFPNELSFKEGDIIHLIRYIDSEWMEGELNGKVGVFPKSFITVVVDCESNAEILQTSQVDEFPANIRARVLYDFKAQYDSDLSIKCDEIVTLKRRINEEWVEGVNQAGEVGVFPNNFVEIIDDSICGDIVSDSTQHSNGDTLIDLNDKTDFFNSINIPSVQTSAQQNTLTEAKNIEDNSNKPIRPAPPLPSLNVPVVSASSNSDINATNTTSTNEVRKSAAIESSYNDTEIERRDEAKRKKDEEQRSVIITEMLQSERDYLRDLKILYSTIVENEKVNLQFKESNLNIANLFGNLDEVIAVSEKLVKSLEESTLCKKFENQMIGKCFINSADEMREAYGHYCRNHDEVAIIWEKIESNQEVKRLFQKGLEKIQRETNCFDIPSMLIKPVQRILKYPLLLNELYQVTSSEHSDKNDLEKAKNLMVEVATNINEFKRRKDLVFKYRKDENSSFSSKISKLNMHTVIKKSSRFGYRLSSSMGFSNAAKDEEFDAEVSKLHSLEKSIKLFLKGINAFIEQSKELVTTSFHISEEIAAFYDEKSKQVEVDELRRIQRLILTDFREEMKRNVDEHVIDILTQLLQKFQTPNKLIAKRNDKYIDYIASNKRLDSNKEPSKQKVLNEENNIARQNFEALNMQLVDDIPKFVSSAIQIFKDAVFAFIKIRKTFTGRAMKEMLELNDLPLLQGSSMTSIHDIIETFQVKHNLIVDKILFDFSIIPKHVFPGASSAGVSSLDRRRSTRTQKAMSLHSQLSTHSKNQSPQSPNQKLYLQNAYQNNTFVVTEDYEPVDVLDLSARKGDYVGVIKDKDPSGSSHRWFVDNGVAKGFLPRRLLQPLASTPKRYNSAPTMPAQSKQRDHLSTPVTTSSRKSFPLVNRRTSLNISQTTSDRTADNLIDHMLKRNSTIDSSGDHNARNQLQPKYPAPAPPTINRPQLKTEPITENRYEEVPDESFNYENLSESQLIDFKSAQETKRSSKIDEDLSMFDPLSNSGLNTGHRYEEVNDSRYDDVDKTPEYESSTKEFYYALYDFNPTGENQLKLKRGQVILVKRKCDLRNNSEWWFVEDRYGNEGYVPKNYITLLKK